jgi:predicted ribosomally synthesized peptide with nif11-like leader
VSNEAIKEFFARTESDTQLQAQVKRALEERGEMAAFEIVDIAAEAGFVFTATDLREHFVTASAEGELDEAALEAVAGGLFSGLRARFLRARGRARGVRMNVRRQGLRARMNVRKLP